MEQELGDPQTHPLEFATGLRRAVEKSGPGQLVSLVPSLVQLIQADNVAEMKGNIEPLCFATRKIGEKLAETDPVSAMNVLEMAVRGIDKTEAGLTPLHTDVLRLALVAGAPSKTAAIANYPYVRIAEKSGITAADIASFFYHAGMVQCALGLNRMGIESFRLCVTHPAVVVSAIVVAAYRRLVLLSLIEFGDFAVPVPKINKLLKHVTPAYSDIRSAFVDVNSDVLLAKINQHTETLRSDGTYGLALETLRALQKFKIKKFTATYITMTLDDMSKKVGSDPEEIIALLVEMIDSGSIFATINERDRVVVFSEDTQGIEADQYRKELVDYISRVNLLNDKIIKYQRELALHPKALRPENERPAGMGGAIPFDGPDP